MKYLQLFKFFESSESVTETVSTTTLPVTTSTAPLHAGTLPVIDIVADRETGHQYPFYYLLNKEEKKLFNDRGPIGRKIRSKASFLENVKKIKKLRLIFPEKDWEVDALSFFEKFKVWTTVFTSMEDAVNFVRRISTNNIKVDELVIGSHGTAGTLLMTKEGEYWGFFDSFLEDLKKIIHPATRIFFTACKGADYLDTLKDAAEKLGVGAYGSAGDYDYINNTSEKGFYWCSGKKFELPKSEKSINPISYDQNGRVYIKLPLPNEELKNIEYKVTIKRGVIDDSDHNFDSKMSRSSGRDQFFQSQARGSLILPTFIFEVRSAIYFYFLDNFELKRKKNPYQKKQEDLASESIDMDQYIIEKIKSDDIIIEIKMDNTLKNIKDLQPINPSVEITNEYLLNNNLCRRVNDPPINWIDTSGLLRKN